jgi:hypothetical protein
MNKSAPKRLLWLITTKAAWAPILVIIFRWLAMAFHIREQLDHVIHFSGGVAICYFLYQSIGICSFYVGTFNPPIRYFLAFTTSCTVALFWEFGEFASDIFLGTHIQHSISETLFDLIFGTLGASTTIALLLISRFFRAPSPHTKCNTG